MSWEKNFSQRGSVMVAIFASIAAVGVVGAVSMNTMKGPVRSMHNVTQKTIAENNMIAAGKLALMAAINQPDGGDCDGDGTIEPIPFSTTGEGPHPDGGGYLPATIGAAKLDPWNNEYGYCVWDHGTAIHNAACGTNRLRGQADENGIVIAVISSGPDRVFQTSCGNAPAYVNRVSGSDDIILAYSYAEAATMSGGLWNIKAGDPGTAEINKDLEVRSHDGHVAFGVDTRSDANRPAIRVDYINRLTRNFVEFLSNINIDSNHISGDGSNRGLSFAGARGNFSHGLDVANSLSVTHGASVTGNITLPGNTTIAKDTTARSLLIYGGASQTTGAGIQLYGGATTNFGRMFLNFGGSADPSYIRFRNHNGAGWTNIMDIHSTGNIGIGNTNPQERLHTAGNLRADGRSLLLGPSQRLYGDDSSALYWDSNNAASQIILRNNSNTNVGRLYANASRIGLQEPDGTWSYRADYGASTMFYVDGAIRMRLYPDYLHMQSNQIRNLAAPTADHHAATRRYVDDRVAAGTGFVEQDPKIGGITNGRWCYATGGRIVCDRVAPVLTEVDPKVGTLTNERWCRSDGSRVICDQFHIVAQHFNGNWCRATGPDGGNRGGRINCNLGYNSVVTRNMNLLVGDITNTINSQHFHSIFGNNTASSGTPVGIYGQANSGYGTYCQGQYCGGNRAWSNTSDERLKTNIEEFPDEAGLAAIMRLRPVTYQWRNNPDGKPEYGFIAQEVEEIFPEMVGLSPDTTIKNADGSAQEISHVKALSYSSFVVPLVKAVQELKADNDDLRRELDDLKASLGHQDGTGQAR